MMKNRSLIISNELKDPDDIFIIPAVWFFAQPIAESTAPSYKNRFGYSAFYDDKAYLYHIFQKKISQLRDEQ